MREINCGTLDLAKGLVDISDPGYELDKYLYIDSLKVKPGIWNASLLADDDNLIYSLKISHEDFNGKCDLEKNVGEIGVDSGLAGFFASPRHEYTDAEWDRFVSEYYENDSVYMNTLNGVITNSGYGDGWYDVTAQYCNNEIVSLTLTFIEDEEDELKSLSVSLNGYARKSEVDTIKSALMAFIEKELPEYMEVNVYTEMEEM